MKILVIGSGGREHALGLKLSQSPQSPTLHFAPGNPGMESLGACHPVAADDVDGLLALAKREAYDLTVVGPEIPLVLGLVDRFQAAGLRVFGPTAAAARLEGSKAFSKAFMVRHGIPTARFQTFTELTAARTTLEAWGAPIVVKASGLAAGKGAVVCPTLEEAEAALESMLGEKAVFGEAGREVVLEEFMQGEEASLFAVCDGKEYVILASAQDHKRQLDGDRGPNTGGMGAYAPAPILTPSLLETSLKTIVEPTLKGMASEGSPYSGVLYVGLMLTPQGPKVVEFNCRLGDPETQVVLPLLQGDLVDLLFRAAEGRLAEAAPVQNAGCAAVVVMAAGGYPGDYRKGLPIEGLETAAALPGVQVLHAGTRREGKHCVTAGGRVLGVVGQGRDLPAALQRAYAGVGALTFPDCQFRRDIGQKGLHNLVG